MVAATSTDVAQGYVLVAGSFPAETTDVSSLAAVVATEGGLTAQVSQAYVIVAAIGRVNDPVVRGWTFTLDGHDFIVYRLGNQKTLLYDTHSQQWYNWGSGDGDLWRAYNGCNWLGGDGFASAYGSNVVVGDDGNGSLYFLDPDGETDDDALLGEDEPRTFERFVQGQVVVKGYGLQPCYGVSLIGSTGEVTNTDLTSVTLSYSDDRGETYSDAGTREVEADAYDTRLHWRSLGSIRLPGRIFKVTDYGALKRIDSLDMEDGE
jgi:phosphohistidine swiveling domain-containing protein